MKYVKYMLLLMSGYYVGKLETKYKLNRIIVDYYISKSDDLDSKDNGGN